MSSMVERLELSKEKKIKNKNVKNEETLKGFLIQSAMNNKRLYHYTTYEGLLSIIAHKCFRLTRLDKLNDKAEVKIGDKRFSKRYYVMSFTRKRESVAMWKMYGKTSGIKLRLDFDTKQFIETVKKIYYLTEEEPIINKLSCEEQFESKKPDKKSKEELKKDKHYINQHITKNFIKDFSQVPLFADQYVLADIVYIDEETGRARHNGKRIKNLTENVRNYANINGYLKYSTWEYEKETRFRVAPSFIDEDIEYIYIEFGDSLISDFHITYNPCMSDELKNAITESLDNISGCKLSYTDSKIDNEIEDL